MHPRSPQRLPGGPTVVLAEGMRVEDGVEAAVVVAAFAVGCCKVSAAGSALAATSAPYAEQLTVLITMSDEFRSTVTVPCDGSDVITAIELAQGMQTLGYRGMTLDTWRERMAHVQDAKRNQAALNDWYMTFNEFVMAYEVHATSIDGAP